MSGQTSTCTSFSALRLFSQGKRRDHESRAFCLFYRITNTAPMGHSYEILFALVLAGDLQDHIAEGEAGAGVDVAEILIRLSAPVGDGGNKHIAGQEP